MADLKVKYEDKKIKIRYGGGSKEVTLLPDISILPLFYPLYVVTVNRMVESPVAIYNHQKILRVPGLAIFQDLRKVVAHCGPKGLFLGYLPSLLMYGKSHCLVYGDTVDEEFQHPIGRYLVIGQLFLLNPFQMLLTRM